MFGDILKVIGYKKPTLEDVTREQLKEAHGELLRCEARAEEYQSAISLQKKRIARLESRLQPKLPVNVSSLERQNNYRQAQ